MIKILFVDDEPNILDALARMLRPMRFEWSMTFVGSGQAALSELEKDEFDVVVSDMKMPGIDGAQLLGEVRKLYPHVIRIILSGYSEKEAIMKSIGATHQFLAKPCDPDSLKSTIKRVCALRDLLRDEHLRQLVSQMPNIPSLPTLYTELIDELTKNEPSTRTVAQIVKKDIGMTVKILQIVNSAFFGLRRRISDSNEAVEFLGLDTISSLTLGLGIISQLEQKLNSGAMLAKLWEHSMRTGLIANKIGHRLKPAIAVDSFTAGLLHDIGEVVLAVNLPKDFVEVSKMVEQGERRLFAERRVFETTHAEIGAYLLGLWGLPQTVVEAVAYHHTPMESATDEVTPLTAVHLANALEHHASYDGIPDWRMRLDAEYVQKLSLTEKIEEWSVEFAPEATVEV